MKINSTESYLFFLAWTYRARIHLSFTNTRGIQYSPYINLCVSPYRVPNLTLGTKYSILMNIKNCILNVPKHGNKARLNPFRNSMYICIQQSVRTNQISFISKLSWFTYPLIKICPYRLLQSFQIHDCLVRSNTYFLHKSVMQQRNTNWVGDGFCIWWIFQVDT